MKRRLLPLVMLAVLAACGAPQATTEHRTRETTMPESSPPIPRATPSIAPDRVADLVRGNTQFALDLYRSLPANQNLIVSPYGIALAFSMLYAGARGSTEAQIAEVLHYLPPAEQHAALNALDQQITTPVALPSGMQGSPFALEIAQRAWGQQGFPFEPAYRDLLAQQYGAALGDTDFGQTEAARQAINGWVAQRTHDRIPDLFPPGSITADTRLVLANAIWFKASWAFPFDPSATGDGPWTRLDDSTVDVPLMMQRDLRAAYVETDEYQAIVLPYVGWTTEMLVIVPADGRFREVEAELTDEQLANLRTTAQDYLVTLTLPRWKHESSIDLVRQLESLGLTLPFGATADLSGMTAQGGLYVSAALHRATIAVDEQGTEASAATGIAVAESLPPRAELRADRPFIYAIRDRSSGTLLFLGRVLDPSR